MSETTGLYEAKFIPLYLESTAKELKGYSGRQEILIPVDTVKKQSPTNEGPIYYKYEVPVSKIAIFDRLRTSYVINEYVENIISKLKSRPFSAPYDYVEAYALLKSIFYEGTINSRTISTFRDVLRAFDSSRYCGMSLETLEREIYLVIAKAMKSMGFSAFRNMKGSMFVLNTVNWELDLTDLPQYPVKIAKIELNTHPDLYRYPLS